MNVNLPCLWLLCSLTLCLAQVNQTDSQRDGKPNLSGTWALDISGSNFGQSKGGLAYDQLTLTISHRDPDLKITRKVVKDRRARIQELSYRTDAKGESNPTLVGKDIVKSKTAWNGNKLVSKATIREIFDGNIVFYEFIDEWELSNDSNTLTHKTSIKSERVAFRKAIIMPLEGQSVTRIFRRVPK